MCPVFLHNTATCQYINTHRHSECSSLISTVCNARMTDMSYWSWTVYLVPVKSLQIHFLTLHTHLKGSHNYGTLLHQGHKHHPHAASMTYMTFITGVQRWGVYGYLYPQNQPFLWGKNDVRTVFNSFIPPKLLYPQNKFLAMPLLNNSRVWTDRKTTDNSNTKKYPSPSPRNAMKRGLCKCRPTLMIQQLFRGTQISNLSKKVMTIFYFKLLTK